MKAVLVIEFRLTGFAFSLSCLFSAQAQLPMFGWAIRAGERLNDAAEKLQQGNPSYAYDH